MTLGFGFNVEFKTGATFQSHQTVEIIHTTAAAGRRFQTQSLLKVLKY